MNQKEMIRKAFKLINEGDDLISPHTIRFPYGLVLLLKQ
jgi:hypothetical protein